MKICTKCKENKPLTNYFKDKRAKDGHLSKCKVCVLKYQRDNADRIRDYRKKYFQRPEVKEKTYKWSKKYKENNKDKVRATNKKYRENNVNKIRASDKKYRQRPDVKEKTNKRLKQRYRTDINFRLANNLRCRLRSALSGKNKSASTLALLGCSVDHLKKHLEKQFQPGMTWKNKNDWHIDHIIPCASFDLCDPIQQQQCFHYSNLQPLWAAENLSKNDKELYHRTWIGTQWVNSYKSALTTLRSFTSLPSSGV